MYAYVYALLRVHLVDLTWLMPRNSGAVHGRTWAGLYIGISKGSQNILRYNFIITTFDCPGASQGRGISAKAFALARPGVTSPLPLKSNVIRLADSVDSFKAQLKTYLFAKAYHI